MTTRARPGLFDPIRLARTADALAAAVAVSLPWSTSATGILVVLWLLAVLPTLDWPDVRRTVLTPAGGLPVLLVALGMLGMLWADVSWGERWGGVESFFKLLVIPLLLLQFRRSDRGLWVLGGYLVSCIVLLLASTLVLAWPNLSFVAMHPDNVLVKNAATQSGEFVTCIFGLLYLAVESVERRRWPALFGLLAVTLAMLANIFYVATGRTALAIIPVLLAIFALKKLSAKGIGVLFAGAILVGVAGWYSSPYLRDRTLQIWTDFQKYEATDQRNSSGERIEFWKKSLGFVRAAPIIGHGTGSIHPLFIESSIGQTGAEGSATTNPHNQTFAVAIQLGLVGVLVLWAMWIAHLLLFRGNGLVEWIGLVVVVQNIVGSLFNSHLFDFAQGWVYVFGVGVAGGMALKHRVAEKASDAAAAAAPAP
jgi:O-antigen ligase